MPEELVTEWADVYKVLDSSVSAPGISEEQMRQVQAERWAERGGCEERLRLVWTEEAPPA